MEIRCYRMPLLVRRNSGRGEVYAPKMKTFLRSPREYQVPAMDRIKGPAKESDIHGFRKLNDRPFNPVYLLIHKIRNLADQ